MATTPMDQKTGITRDVRIILYLTIGVLMFIPGIVVFINDFVDVPSIRTLVRFYSQNGMITVGSIICILLLVFQTKNVTGTGMVVAKHLALCFHGLTLICVWGLYRNDGWEQLVQASGRTLKSNAFLAVVIFCVGIAALVGAVKGGNWLFKKIKSEWGSDSDSGSVAKKTSPVERSDHVRSAPLKTRSEETGLTANKTDMQKSPPAPQEDNNTSIKKSPLTVYAKQHPTLTVSVLVLVFIAVACVTYVVVDRTEWKPEIKTAEFVCIIVSAVCGVAGLLYIADAYSNSGTPFRSIITTPVTLALTALIAYKAISTGGDLDGNVWNSLLSLVRFKTLASLVFVPIIAASIVIVLGSMLDIVSGKGGLNQEIKEVVTKLERSIVDVVDKILTTAIQMVTKSIPSVAKNVTESVFDAFLGIQVEIKLDKKARDMQKPEDKEDQENEQQKQ